MKHYGLGILSTCECLMDAGVFKNWPNSDANLVDVTRVEELRVLKQTDVSQPAEL